MQALQQAFKEKIRYCMRKMSQGSGIMKFEEHYRFKELQTQQDIMEVARLKAEIIRKQIWNDIKRENNVTTIEIQSKAKVQQV
jgi:hypothetical protein